MRIIVLGSAAGGGFPQWNCFCPNCRLAWEGDPRVRPRTQSSLAISADGNRWLLLNASPDLRQQIYANSCLHPRGAARQTPIAGVFLTNGDVDHLAGLLTLREQQAFTIYGSASLLDQTKHGAFGVLNPDLVRRLPVALEAQIDMGLGFTIRPFAVPGKVPLYLEGESVEIGAATDTTVGVEIDCDARRAIVIPGCADVTDDVLRRVEGADVLFFDGTTFTDDEMLRMGLSQKTAWRMGHCAIDGERGSLARFADSKIRRRVYTHINNSNPILLEDSPERAKVEAAGWIVAHDGLEIAL
ncbi:MAG: pyrroloquinoline quinone biosynthesis protein PqqB [Methylobacteriaceae bacterium]|nr:pyrroloquinoline quinone biosynthesis protein PqqB [Methylobacteriaceae bacterium]